MFFRNFKKNNVTNFSFEKAKLSDNLKQSMSFDLKDGGKSGDQTKNSDLHKLAFKSKDKAEITYYLKIRDDPVVVAAFIHILEWGG